MFNLGTLGAAVTLDDSQYRASLQQLGTKTNSILSKVSGIAAAYLGFNSLKNAVVGCVSAFIKQENAVNSLERALSLKGQAAYSKKLQQVASDLQAVTVFGDETTIAAMAMGVNMGIAADKMEDTTKAAMGLAAAHNMDLTTSMQLLAKANAGNTGALSRYGIQIDSTKSKQAQFNQVLELGKKAFPLAEAQTTGQKLQQLAGAWGDLMETIGEFISELFDVKGAASAVTDSIKSLTDFIKKNMDEWIFQIKYVYYYVEASFKAIFAVIEPALTFIGQIFTAAVQNLISIAQWGMENIGKIWEHLPEIFYGIGKDIYTYYKNFFTSLYNLAKNLGDAIWNAIIDGDTSGFEKTWKKLKEDSIRTVAETGKYTEQALAKSGATPFPELKQADFSGMIDKYKNLDNTFADIDQRRIEKQAKLEEAYAKKLERSKNGQDNKKSKTGGKSSGTFSAADIDTITSQNRTVENIDSNVSFMKEELEKIRKNSKSGYGTVKFA